VQKYGVLFFGEEVKEHNNKTACYEQLTTKTSILLIKLIKFVVDWLLALKHYKCIVFCQEFVEIKATVGKGIELKTRQ